MAPKRPNPLEEPPAASSSEEEEASSSEEEEDDDDAGQAKKEDSSSEEEEDEEADERDGPPLTPKPSTASQPSKRPDSAALPAAATAKVSQTGDSGSDSGSEAETESDSASEHENRSDSRVKPIASKPMADNSKSKGSKPSDDPKAKSSRENVIALAARPSKRLVESDPDAKQSKRAKKKETEAKPDNGVVDRRKQGEDSKKQMFQRIFSEDDEVALLKGILDYTADKGDPYADLDSFYDFIKNYIDFEASKAQLVDKIRRLKIKYENHIKKGKNASKPHDQKVFDLSKKIWGSEGVLLDSAAKTYKKKQRGNSEGLSAYKAEVIPSHNAPEEGKREIARSEIDQKVAGDDMVTFLQMMPGLDESTIKQVWDRLEGRTKIVLEEKLRVIHNLEIDLYARRAELLHEAAGFMLKTYKADNQGSKH